MENIISQRIRELAKYKGKSIKAFAEAIGMPQTTVSNYVNGSRECSFELVKRIADTYSDVSLRWLISGEGEIINSGNEQESRQPVFIPNGLIPEVEFTFAAGQTELVNATPEATGRWWRLPDCTDCEAVVPVAGASMMPTLPPGCHVALKRYHFGSNPNSIPFGNVFGVVVEDDVTGDYHGHIKVLRRHPDPETASRYWIAHSLNPDFDDFDIPIAQVRSLWIVKQHIVTDHLY